MAALTSGSWTIAYRNGTRYNSTNIMGRKREVRLTLSLTTGEVPAAGVPLPGAGSVGMVRFLEGYTFDNTIDPVLFTTAAGRAIQWVLNTTANKLLAYRYSMASSAGTPSGGRALRPCATAVSITGTKKFFVTAKGW